LGVVAVVGVAALEGAAVVAPVDWARVSWIIYKVMNVRRRSFFMWRSLIASFTLSKK
jgi:hypothetical protein